MGLFVDKKRGVQDHRTIREVRPISLYNHLKVILDKENSVKFRAGVKEILKSKLKIGVSKRYKKRVTKKEFENYFKFAVVRNPWDRVYSWYKNVLRDKKHGIPQCSLISFLTKYSNNWALRPQLFWIEDFDGSIPLDKVVKFENLKEEMEEVLLALNIENKNLPKELVHSEEKKYADKYNKETYKIVEKRYKKEIEMFGYAG